ncbi:MAG TPA: copper amine oxidase N-terminal domain-containing protein [Syntrophomonadaceae bacterium]|nr:copper amine oxidase N-terminal domain-containing protein [Syntrophomonadaceae bacterium]HPU49467.1 copper amine oxidase N-terminal domain-containing protein [Syntrophomonadaceae bacterium]
MMRGLITACIMIFLLPLTAMAQTAGYTLEINGATSISDVSPQMVQGQMYVPLRPIVEALKGTITYDPSSRMVTAWRTGFQLEFRIGEKVASYAGDTLAFDNETWIYQGRTMVPVELIEKAFDCQIQIQDETVKIIPRMEYWIQQEQIALSDESQGIVHLKLITNAGGWPDYWVLILDNQEIARLDDEDGLYSRADMQLKDITGDGVPEILVSSYGTGTSGAQGLEVYSWDDQKLVNIFDSPSWDEQDLESRYEVKYIGNYQVSFHDCLTGETHLIRIDREEFTADEDRLYSISTWIDPISSYQLVDEDGDGVYTIITDQRVIGVAHVHTLAHLQTVYSLEQGKYQLTGTKLRLN